MNKKKLGGLGKLSQFSGIKSSQPREETVSKEEITTPIDSNNNEDKTILIDSSNQESEITPINATNEVIYHEEIPVIDETVEEKVIPKKAVTKKPKKSIKDKPVTINIKISKSQKDWLSDTASMVRDNNDEPVPPSERVYPQHLIGVAISLLQSSDIDWSQVKNEKELRQQLNL